MPDFMAFVAGMIVILAIIGLVASFHDHVVDKERPFARIADELRRDGVSYDEIIVDPEYAAREREMTEAVDKGDWRKVIRDGRPVGVARLPRVVE